MFQQQNLSNYTTISYHMSWPGEDPYYNYNPGDGGSRRGYYALNWVPYMVIDGANDEGDLADWQNHVLADAATTAPLEIAVSGQFNVSTGVGNCIVNLTPEDGVDGTHTMHVVLVEDSLYYMGSNGFPHHENVMRDMFPSALGTSLSLNSNVETVAQTTFNVPSEMALENCRLVVFVQNAEKEILNAALVDITNMSLQYMPFLSVISTNIGIIDDDGDDKLNPGESASYVVGLENSCDWMDASDINATLHTTNPYVTITDSLAVYDMLVPCDFSMNIADPFSFTIAEDAPVSSDIEFSIRVTANQSADAPFVPYETTIPLLVEIDLYQKNFPVAMTQPTYGGNAAVDLNGDGSKEVITAGMDSLVHAITLDGVELDGFPFQVGNWIIGSPAVADIDNDGFPEIVVESYDKFIYLIQHDGSGVALAEALNKLTGTPTLADLDGDGDLEIIAASYGNDIIILHHDGTAFTGFPVIISGERISRGMSVADINGDGQKDIVIGTLSDKIHVIGLDGAELAGFPVDIEDKVNAAPLVTDLTGDGSYEILVGQDGGVFYAISNSGAILWSRELSTEGIRTAASVHDWGSDGLMETVITTLDGLITVVDYAGNDLEGWPQNLAGDCYSSPVVADLDGDGIPEILVGSFSAEIYAFHFDGTPVMNFPVPLSSPARGTPTVDDLNQDGTQEIVIGTDYDLSIINLKIPSPSGLSWFTTRGNYARTGLFLNPLVSVEEELSIPKQLVLKQNYPNPFNPSTSIEFGIPNKGLVTLTIYDILGKEVSQLLQSDLAPGSYSAFWNGQDSNAKLVGTGIYFARINASGSEEVIKMMLIK